MIRQGETGTGAYTEFPLHNEIWKRLMNLSCTNSLPENQPDKNGFYPNPAQTEVFFNQQGTPLTVLIYDALGREIMKVKAVNKLNVSNLKPGTYFIQLNENEKKLTKKLVIN